MMYLALGLTSARRRDGETIQNANEAGTYKADMLVDNNCCYPLTSKAENDFFNSPRT